MIKSSLSQKIVLVLASFAVVTGASAAVNLKIGSCN
jgi:hypothetical protein